MLMILSFRTWFYLNLQKNHSHLHVTYNSFFKWLNRAPSEKPMTEIEKNCEELRWQNLLNEVWALLRGTKFQCSHINYIFLKSVYLNGPSSGKVMPLDILLVSLMLAYTLWYQQELDRKTFLIEYSINKITISL